MPARYFWLLAAAALPSACAARVASPAPTAVPAQSVSAHQASKSNAPEAVLSVVPKGSEDELGPRLFPPLENSSTASVGVLRDGSEELISYGLRVLSRPDGALELAREYLPAARNAQALELPSRLGGGFLFYVLSSSATLFFRAATFTGELEPFARLDFEADQVIAGFDRLYVLSHRPDRLVALDAEHGTALGLGSLPPSPGYGKMAFADGFLGAVQVPLRGTLVSFDAGGSWRPLAFPVTNLRAEGDALLLSGVEGSQALDSAGTFSRRDEPSQNHLQESELARALRGAAPRDAARVARDLASQRALKQAVLRGFRDAAGNFIVASAGTLRRVRPSDGKVLETDAHAYAGGGECSALPYGPGFGFVCSDDDRRTTLFSFVPPFGMRVARVFSGARYVSASGNGSLVIRGACSGSNAGAAGAYCIADSAGKFREIHVHGDAGVERVVALADGRVAILVPPRLGAPGFLSLLDSASKEQRLPLKFAPGVSSAGASLLEKGLWLAGFVELPAGSPGRRAAALAGWVVGSEPFAGVRVALDGTVDVSAAENSVDRVLLSGTRALLVGRTGRALETTDGGFAWSSVDLPSEFDAGHELRDDARLQGCSELGCAFAGFVRVGWKAGSAAAPLRVAALPKFTSLIQPGGNRWVLRCEATGEVSEPALAQGSRVRGPGRSEEATVAPWAPFHETAAPTLAAGEVGYDTGGVDADLAALHVYAWGERSSDWGVAGHTQVRALDRFDVARGTFQSAVTHSPWPDATAAAEAFGFDGTGNPATWRALMETGQRSAAVLTASRGLLDLLLFEEAKAVTRIPNAGRLGFGMLTSVAKLRDAWYAGAYNENHAFTLSRIQGNHVERLREYPDTGRDQGSIAVVRGVRDDELGIWVIGSGWYLFPVDPKSFALRAPLVQSPADLAQMPPACAPDADGFLLSGAPSLEPSLRFLKEATELPARRVEAQFIWSAHGLCTRALAADTDSAIKHVGPERTPASARPGSVPLALTERRPQGRRFGYACSQ
ncbi:MAG: hypothetical protein ABJB12_07510 [Pseudomonadota bacterium]